MRLGKKWTALATAAVVGMALTGRADAALVVAPTAEATTPGGLSQFELFGNGSDITDTFQELIAASQLSAIPVGTQITSIGYRLGGTTPTVTTSLDYSQYSIRIGKSANPIGALNAVYASNLGADTVTARSGPLTIPAGSFVGGAGANPFYTLTFTTPYTYTGGDLLITTVQATSDAVVPSVGVDAVDYGTVTDTDGTTVSSNTTSGETEFFTAPVVQFGTVAVPEPSAVLAAGGMAAAALCRRRKARRPAGA